MPSTNTALFFVATTLLTLWFLYKATQSISLIIGSVIWLAIHAMMAHANFYSVTTSVPPRPMLLVGPPLLFILLLFVTKKGRAYIDTFSDKWLTYLHSVRIPVEIVLLILSTYQLVPKLMTFEGRNFDVLSGLSAPVVAYLFYTRKSIGRKFMLTWNFICLGLLLNVVINAVLALPTVFQMQAFDVPNVGVLYAPYVFLPCFIVPVVLFAHLVCIRRLLKEKV